MAQRHQINWKSSLLLRHKNQLPKVVEFLAASGLKTNYFIPILRQERRIFLVVYQERCKEN